MTTMQIVRRGLIAGMAAAAMTPGSAMATHNGTCPGFQDPACNIQYFNDHTLGAVIDNLDPVLNTIAALVDDAGEAAQRVLCRYFGAYC